MRRIAFLLVAVASLASVIAYMVPASGQAAQNSAPVYVTTIPSGYRDWQWISSAHEAGNLNSLGAVLGNDVAIRAYRERKLPFPDGTIIAALHYRNVPSEENNKVFGQAQSFVPGPPTNIQFMVKDSTKLRKAHAFEQVDVPRIRVKGHKGFPGAFYGLRICLVDFLTRI